MIAKHSIFNTILGNIQLSTEDGKMTKCTFTPLEVEPIILEEHCAYIDQIESYFEGNLKAFNIPLDPKGTSFQKMVWEALLKIPFGEVTTYGALARQLGPRANPRNIGQANGQNPIAIIIPCHRVVGQDMKLTGYASGIERKRKLLEIENAFKQQQLF